MCPSNTLLYTTAMRLRFSLRDKVRHLLFLGLLLLAGINVDGAIYYSRVATGNFANVSTWSTSPTGTPANNTALTNTDVFIIQSGHTITVAANQTVASITVNSGGQLTIGSNTFTVTGTTMVSGTILIASNTSVKTFTGLVTINAGGTWTSTAATTASRVVFKGGITTNSANVFSAAGATFNSNNQDFSGTGSFNFQDITVNGVTLTNNETLTVGTSLSGTGRLENASSGVLNIGGTITVSTLTATATGNTVNYSGGNQTGISTIYNNLTISGTNTKTFATTPTVTGTLSMEGTASIVVTTGAVTYGSNATLQYNKATNYTATTEEWPATFAGTGGVKILNTGVITFGARKRVIYNLSIATTAKVNLGTLKTHTAGSLTLGGANSCGTWGYGPGTPPVNKNQTYFANTTGYITVSSPVPDFSGSVTNATCPSSADGAIDLDEGIEAGVGFDNTSGSFIDLNTPFLNNLSGFTLEGWINIDLADITGDRVGSLFGQNDAIEFGFYDANSIQCWTAGGGSVNISSTNYPNDGNWHHIAAVGNGTNITIYMDGVAVGSPGGTTTTNYGSSAYSAKIGGGVWDESGGSLTGPILKTGFWNRPLSATEIANLASGYYTYIGTESGLIAGYNLDEASGETVTPVPYSVNNNGSFVNTPVWVNIYNYLWRKSGDPLFTATTKDISGLNPGTYEVTVSNTCYSLSKSFTVTNLYPNLSAVSLSPSSNQTICHNGTGSAVAVTETGGGPITARQWGKRLVSGGAITAITGETAATYTPTAIDLGTGSWFLVCTSTPTCGAPIVSNEVPVTVYPDFSLGTIPSTGETLCSGSNPSIIS